MPRVLYVQYTNPAGYPPLQHSSRILADRGWDVWFLGTGAFGANNLRFPWHPRITVRQMNFCPAGWRQKLHYLRYCAWVLFCTITWRPQVIYASDTLACPIALALTWLPRLRVVYHEHDSPSGVNGTVRSPSSLFNHLLLYTRHQLAHRAEFLILPNKQRVARFQETTGRRNNVFCVWNCPAKEEVAQGRPHSNGREWWLLYHGSIVPSRLPMTILSALVMLPDIVKLRVIGYQTVGHGTYLHQFRQKALALGIENRLHFLGPLPTRAELLQWGQKSDVGLALMPQRSSDINEQTMAGASNKPFDYLACGLALLVPELPDWRATFVEPGYGLACLPNDPDSIAAALRWFLEHPNDVRAMGKRGQQRVATDWNYHKQFTTVLQCLSQSQTIQ